VSREADVAAIAEKAKADPKIIVTIKSYAGGTEDQALQAKRTALTRAISVRDYLLKTGVKSDQISVRPMGNKNEAGVPDRIDIFLESGANQRG
jgi:outer membrane protein OmpA-like peptidoglycan-associated protein